MTESALTKQSGETRLFEMDFANKLTDGELINSVDSLVSYPAGHITIATHSITTDGTVNILVSGGTSVKTYKITVTVTTDIGQILENEGYLVVEDV